MKRQSARGSGTNPNNALSRELTKAKQAARMVRSKPKKPIKVLLRPAEYVPQQVLIKKP
jgi:hypothetical protein